MTKSTNCTVNHLTANNICEIIIACGKAGVTEFKLNGLNIKLGLAPVALKAGKMQSLPVLQDLAGQVESEALQDEGDDIREKQISETIVTDPMGFEELLLNGEINVETYDSSIEQQI